MADSKTISFTSEVRDNGKVLITQYRQDEIESDSYDDLFKFLLEDWGTAIKICWDLDEFVAPLLRLIGKTPCLRLGGNEHKCYIQPFILHYIPGKEFTIRYGRYSATIYGITQYFPDYEAPETAFDVSVLGDYLIDTLREMGLYPTKLSSPIAIFDECVMRHMTIPTIYDKPDDVLDAADYALKCTGRLWLSSHQIGHWKEGECHEYDIKSAFPSQAVNLYSTNNCEFVYSTTLIENADWGFLRGHLNITSPVSPISYRWESGRLSNPVGEWDDYITLAEWCHIQKYGLGEFDLKDGWFLHFTNLCQPLHAIINRLFQQRSKQPVKDLITKRIMVGGFYGKFLEQYESGKYGRYFNPFYASQIATGIRLKVSELIQEKQLAKHIIAIGVDSLLVDEPISLNGVSPQMGEWKHKDETPAIVLSSGLVFSGGKHPKGLYYDNLIPMIRAKPRSSLYQAKLPRKVTLREALQGDFSTLGNKVLYSESLDLRTLDPDRHFATLPKTGEQLLNKRFKSEPFKVGD
jgi:hypothetical protein